MNFWYSIEGEKTQFPCIIYFSLVKERLRKKNQTKYIVVTRFLFSMGSCRNTHWAEESTAAGGAEDMMTDATTGMIRLLVIWYGIACAVIYVGFFSRALVRYSEDIYEAVIPEIHSMLLRFTFGTGRAYLPRSESDPAVAVMWAIGKFALMGLAIPIIVSAIWPLWVPPLAIIVMVRVFSTLSKFFWRGVAVGLRRVGL